MKRTVSKIITATTEMVGSNKVFRALPARDLKQVDPFLLIDHLVPVMIAPGDTMRIPPHPHAGFEVVTYLLEGSFFHRDSQGHNQVANGGDLNWMTSGSGIIHSEGPTAEFLASGGRLELMQVWINLPAKDKKLSPSFRHYPAVTLPVADNGDLWVKTLIGTYQGAESPVITRTPLFYHHVKIKSGSTFRLPVHPDHEAALYVMSGRISVGGMEVTSGQLAKFSMDGEELLVEAVEESGFILFGGLPIGEKVVSYGPFVMNSFPEIQQAIGDYEKGKMGILEY
jgi:redox-sensitive bicupin YhaK (pirin superfamily)